MNYESNKHILGDKRNGNWRDNIYENKVNLAPINSLNQISAGYNVDARMDIKVTNSSSSEVDPATDDELDRY